MITTSFLSWFQLARVTPFTQTPCLAWTDSSESRVRRPIHKRIIDRRIEGQDKVKKRVGTSAARFAWPVFVTASRRRGDWSRIGTLERADSDESRRKRPFPFESSARSGYSGGWRSDKWVILF